MTGKELTLFIKEQAIKLGFEACGIAKAESLSSSEKEIFHSWLEKGFQAEMDYLTRNTEKRYDPRLLVEGCKSVVVVALNYQPGELQKPEAPQIARFAYGKDYHDLIRTKLRALLKIINDQGVEVQGRAFADSAPIAERYWANQAGIGWIGKNRHLIIPGKGSRFLLGELLIDIELDYDLPQKNRCGLCKRCLDACPTQALSTQGLDARKCLSYLTIEKRGSFDPSEACLVGESNCLFGCDKCQDACPWNRFSKANNHPELQPDVRMLQMEREDFENLSKVGFKDLFSGTCLERTGYEGFSRNLKNLELHSSNK